MDNKQIFSRNLQYYMDKKNVSRYELANAVGISYFTISSWLSGTKYPRMDKVETLANYFGIQKSDLIEDKAIQKEKGPPAYTGQGDDDEIRRRLHYYADYGEPDVRKKLVELLDLFESQK